VHNQLTLPALEEAAEGELPLVVDRLVGALNEGSGPGGHVPMRLRAQPVDEHPAGGAAADAEHRGLLALPKDTILKIFALHRGRVFAYIQGGVVAGSRQTRRGQGVDLQRTAPSLHRPRSTLVDPELTLRNRHEYGQPLVALVRARPGTPPRPSHRKLCT